MGEGRDECGLEEKLEALLETGTEVAGEGGTCSLMLVDFGPPEITSMIRPSVRLVTRGDKESRLCLIHSLVLPVIFLNP